jgi:putative lipoic acid-binding regulatory protein
MDVLQFPCQFPLKAIGRDPETFEQFVLEIVRKHIPDLPPNASTTRPSNGGRYLAVTVTFTAESRQQLDAIYRELHSHTRVVMLL